MDHSITHDQIRSRVPKGHSLPDSFEDFLRAKLRLRIEWNDLDAYSLKPSALEQAVPFIRLRDGGLIALWYHVTKPAVVHIGGHGELSVIASNFDNFLKAIKAKCTGLSDLDAYRENLNDVAIHGKPSRAGLSTLQKKFDHWFKQHTSLLEPLQTSEAELLRQRLVNIAEEMIGDGRSRVYTLSYPWSMNFRIDRERNDISITYLDYGNWYPVPQEYELVEAAVKLLRLVKDKTKVRYELCILKAGIVSVDRDRELLLVPPKRETL